MKGEWESFLLGEIITLQRGFDLPYRDRKPGSIPVITSAGLNGTHNEAKVSSPGVITGRYGTIGEVFFITEDFWPHNTTLFVSDFKGSDPLFISFLLKTIDFQTYSGKSGVPGVNRNDLYEISVNRPPIEEQRAIAEALADVDGLITGLDKLIAKKRDVKTAVMQQLLTGKKRLPGFENGRWEQITFNDLADRRDQWSITGGPFGSNLKSSDYTEKGVRIIQLQNIGDGEFLNDYQIFTSTRKADELIACNIYPGEILLSKMGDPVARACIVPNEHERYVMCSDGIRLKTDPLRFDNSFIHAYINSPLFRGAAIEASTGSTRQRIGLKELKSLSLTVPLLEEQKSIGLILSDMDAEITALEARRAKTQAIKQGMMQELLTGRTRLL